jgi:uncharacterized membrane protein YfhO
MKKYKEYIYTGLIIFILLSIVYILRGIFPFGNNSIVWSDMHEQITAMYYHFYDAFHSNSSLLIDFSSGGGISFIGIIAYYIASPFTLILLLFPRDLLSNAVSLTVMLKMITAGITCHYFLNYYFKNLKGNEKTILSVIYALSSYVLSMYVITTWMDAVYLFPLLIIGLKKLLDGESPRMYLIILILIMISTFYMSLMVLLFIIFASAIYLFIYKKGKKKGKIIFNLGVSTVLAMITSSIVLVPSLLEVFASPKLGITLDNITKSKFGPLSDKIALFFTLAPVCALTIMQLLKYKKDKKNTIFIFALLLLLGIPVIIEPVNKLWHFGNYVYFTYRYGYMMTLLLVGISAYYLNSYKHIKAKIFDNNKIIPTILSIGAIALTAIVTLKFKAKILKELDTLTITGNKKIAILLIGIFLIYFVVILFTIYTNDFKKKYTKIVIYTLSIVSILFNANLYIGTFDFTGKLKLQYDEMHQIYNDQKFTDNYYLIDQDKNLIMNFGMVTKARTYTNFTSLVNDNNFRTLQSFGYDSLWMDTEGIGGNLFTNMVLGNKYLFTKEKLDDSYYEEYYSDDYFNYYKIKKDMPYGYFINENKSIKDTKNSFEASNILSNEIINKDVFEIDKIFEAKEGIEEFKEDYVEKTYEVTEKERLYLETFIDFYHNPKYKSYKAFKIYVNDKLIKEEYPYKKRTGVLYLGEFENETVKVRIETNKHLPFRNVTIGRLKISDVDYLLDNNPNNIKVEFNKNNINIEIDSEKDGIMMLPLTYLDGYTSNSNEIIKVFDNYVGVKLKKGNNKLTISFFPDELKLGLILSAFGLVLSIIFVELISKIKLPKIIYGLASIAYISIVFLLTFVYYIFGIGSFLLSFIFK